ncbi:hypothetical protein DMH26_14375 [Streptomyces sp. WAC 05379]|uniref:hypothetical protein n=1 Tax=Streptomyces sp. WAC 05379 TaxID=2203207 RepID=UPI000F744965|nr:hypothetical protein [Streptomyces sp. WAC 05379]RSO02327.1 hypothetical protein DMH26_14375 [Streptomyces sp. WAC 05379]
MSDHSAEENRPNPLASLTSGYANSDREFERKRKEAADQRSAENYRENPEMERLIHLRSEDRTTFDSVVSGPLRFALATYERDKANAQSFQR